MLIFKKRRRDYHGATYHVDPARQRKQERSGRLKKILNRFYLIIIASTLIWLVYFVLFMPYFMISKIELAGGVGDRADFTASINKFLETKRVKFLRQKNYFIFDENGLDRYLRHDYFLSKLEISKKFPNKLNIAAEKRTSALNLCFENECFRVDYLGKVITKIESKNLGDGWPLVYYIGEKEIIDDQSASSTDSDELKNLTPEIIAGQEEGGTEALKPEAIKIVSGQTVIAPKKIKTILDLYELLMAAKIIRLKSFEVNSFEEFDNKIIVDTRDVYRVFFNGSDNLKQQIDNLDLILTREIKLNIKNIEYIDLRFGNKIYYR